MRSTLIILCLLCFNAPAFSVPRPRQEIIAGRVVAYSGALACMNGNAYQFESLMRLLLAGTDREFRATSRVRGQSELPNSISAVNRAMQKIEQA